MSQRDMWKMLHLLNNTPRPSLTTQELYEAGVDCYSDTLHALASRGVVVVVNDSGTERWELAPVAREVLNTCTVAQKLEGAGEVQVDRASIFCVMPFSESRSNDLWECVRAAAQGAGLTPIRGDTTLRTGSLVANVWNEILKCGCVVADLTVPNPNVYYELGLARALGRDTVVMVQTGTDLPADIQGTHYVAYPPGDFDSVKRQLKDQLAAWRCNEDVKVDGVESLF